MTLILLTWANHSTTGEHFAFLRDYKRRIKRNNQLQSTLYGASHNHMQAGMKTRYLCSWADKSVADRQNRAMLDKIGYSWASFDDFLIFWGDTKHFSQLFMVLVKHDLQKLDGLLL